MTSPPNDGHSDSDIKRLDMSPFPCTANATVVTSAASPTNVSTTPSSSHDYIPPRTHEATRLKGQRPNNKGKSVQRSLDWHIATRDASESEREGKSSAIVSIELWYSGGLDTYIHT